MPPRYFPLWFPVIILSRDALLLLGYFVLRHFRPHIEIKPHWSGKLSTFFVFLAIAAVLFQAGPWITRLCALGAFFARHLHGRLCPARPRVAAGKRPHSTRRGTLKIWNPLSPSSAGPTSANPRSSTRWSGARCRSFSTAPAPRATALLPSARWDGRKLTLIDTGGIGVEDKAGFQDAIAHEVDLALAAATEIIFVVDAREGLTPLDQIVARQLRKSHAPVFVAANKMDSDKQDSMDAEFGRLGFAGVFPVSAAHRRGLGELREAICAKWPKPDEMTAAPVRPTRLAIVGRPNVGKSSLVNALVSEPRAIVSPIPGTTRDAVDIAYTWRDQPYLLVDTAGMRQERRVDDQLERAMTGRTAHAINRADVCILVVDASTGVSMQDKKIAGLIQDAHAPCIIAVNKWDLAREQGDASKTREREYYDQVQRDLFFLSYAPVVFLSAKTSERIDGLLKMAAMIAKNRLYRFQTGPLNRVIQKAMEKYAPPLVRGRRFKVLYAAQQTPKEDHARSRRCSFS